MIRLATVHYSSPRWIDPQRRYLQRLVGDDYLVYASLEGIDESYDSGFHFVSRMEGTHADKLNALAARIGDEATEDDVLVFLDGDAFPIACVVPWLRETLLRTPLVAIRRDENMGDPQPHPSFCATTVGFWASIGGDWSPGYTWRTSSGVSTTDVGGNLLHELQRRKIKWEPLTRTNRRELHPLWFGVYGDRIYHHGAGFRTPISRLSLASGQRPLPSVPVVRRFVFEWRKRRERLELQETRRLSEGVFARIERDDDFCVDLFL